MISSPNIQGENEKNIDFLFTVNNQRKTGKIVFGLTSNFKIHVQSTVSVLQKTKLSLNMYMY